MEEEGLELGRGGEGSEWGKRRGENPFQGLDWIGVMGWESTKGGRGGAFARLRPCCLPGR